MKEIYEIETEVKIERKRGYRQVEPIKYKKVKYMELSKLVLFTEERTPYEEVESYIFHSAMTWEKYKTVYISEIDKSLDIVPGEELVIKKKYKPLRVNIIKLVKELDSDDLMDYIRDKLLTK